MSAFYQGPVSRIQQGYRKQGTGWGCLCLEHGRGRGAAIPDLVICFLGPGNPSSSVFPGSRVSLPHTCCCPLAFSLLLKCLLSKYCEPGIQGTPHCLCHPCAQDTDTQRVSTGLNGPWTRAAVQWREGKGLSGTVFQQAFAAWASVTDGQGPGLVQCSQILPLWGLRATGQHDDEALLG